MAVDLLALNEELPPVPGHDTKPVTDRESLRQFVSVLAVGFRLAEPVRDAYLERDGRWASPRTSRGVATWDGCTASRCGRVRDAPQAPVPASRGGDGARSAAEVSPPR